MATYESGTGNGYKLRMVVDVTSQNAGNKTSTISWSLYIVNPSNNYFNARSTGGASLGGSSVWSISASKVNSSPSGAAKLLASGSKTFTHTSAGTLTVAIAANFKTETQGYSWSVPYLSLSANFSPPSFSVVPPKPNSIVMWEYQEQRKLRIETESVAGTILEYQIEHRYTKPGQWTAWTAWTTASAGTTRRIEFDGPKAPLKYEFRSRARNAQGWGEWSDVKSYTVRWAPSKMDPPTVSQNGSTGIFIVTAPVADAHGSVIRQYQIMRRLLPSTTWVYLNPNSNRQVIFSAPEPRAQYEFKARAMSDLGIWHSMTESDSVFATGKPSGPWVKHLGVWKKTQVWVKASGKWKKAYIWSRSKGNWKIY